MKMTWNIEYSPKKKFPEFCFLMGTGPHREKKSVCNLSEGSRDMILTAKFTGFFCEHENDLKHQILSKKKISWILFPDGDRSPQGEKKCV